MVLVRFFLQYVGTQGVEQIRPVYISRGHFPVGQENADSIHFDYFFDGHHKPNERCTRINNGGSSFSIISIFSGTRIIFPAANTLV